MMGYSRDSFYRLQQLYIEQGEVGMQELSRGQSNLKNRVDPAIEAAMVAMVLENPALGQLRVSNTFNKRASLFHLEVCAQSGCGMI